MPAPRRRPTEPPAAREAVLVCWSGGKESALALGRVLADGRLAVAALLTVVTGGYERVTLHGVRLALIRRQARALGLPLEVVRIPRQAAEGAYEEAMRRVLARHKARGISRCVFGDVCLAEVRARREENLARIGMGALFPLWQRDTGALARAFLDEGFRAVVACADAARLDRSFCGREFDAALLADLPPGVDPCGENGEYHTFVYDGPIFRGPEGQGGGAIAVRPGETVLRDGFWFTDLRPAAKRRGGKATNTEHRTSNVEH